MASMYILFSEKLNKYYIGHTTLSIQERLNKHLTAHDGFTSKAKDWIIIYYENFNSKEEAARRELAIKNMKSRKYIESLFSK